MNVVQCDDYDDLTIRAAALVISEIERKPDLLLCLATGRSTDGLFTALAEKAKGDPGFFRRLRVVKLDEWGNLPADHPASCEHSLRTRLLQPLGVSPDRYLSFAPPPADPGIECGRIRSALERTGPIDLCVLGLGVNGHVGFNEPGSSLTPHCHVATLSETTRRHATARAISPPPTYGLTLGLGEILASRRIVLLVAGEGKREAATRLLSARVTAELPATFLWLHPRVECLMDRGVEAQAVSPSP
jgi:galactosamine-6-phosphate isomerase